MAFNLQYIIDVIIIKISRALLEHNTRNRINEQSPHISIDSRVDLAGYMRCGVEIEVSYYTKAYPTETIEI